MLSENLSLRISSVFVVFAASFGGILFPLMQNARTDLFKILNTGSAGVMLGLAMMHLLPEAYEILSQEFSGYDWSFALTCAGVVLVLTIEQIVLLYSDHDASLSVSDVKSQSEHLLSNYQVLSDNNGDNGVSSDHSHRDLHSPVVSTLDNQGYRQDHLSFDHTGHTGRILSRDLIQTALTDPHVTQAVSFVRPRSDHQHSDHGDHGDHGDHDHDHGLSNVMHSHSLQKLITAYVLEFSIAVHSVIIGVDLGMLCDPSDNITLITLMIALSFHQFIEGVGLGSAIQASRGSLGDNKVMGFVAIFSLTMPLGILIGIASSSDGMSRAQNIAKGIANSLATGSLVYISLSEMVPEYFGDVSLKRKSGLRLKMLCSFACGVLIIAGIANWA